MSEVTETPQAETSTPQAAASETSTPQAESTQSSEAPAQDEKPVLAQKETEAAPVQKETEAAPVQKETEAAPVEEEYEEYDLDLFEGADLTEEDLQDIAEEASRLNLSKEDAEKLVKIKDAAFKKAIAKKEAEYAQKIEQARKEIQNDPDFVGDKKDQSFASINRAVQEFGDPELIQLLNTPEVGNSLVIARFLKRIGDAIAPDNVSGKGVSASSEANQSEGLKNWYPEFFK